MAATDPEENVTTLCEKHKFKLKGVGPLMYHLGCDNFHDDKNTFCFGPRKYMSKMIFLMSNVVTMVSPTHHNFSSLWTFATIEKWKHT
jgi:hypothetical protein